MKFQWIFNEFSLTKKSSGSRTEGMDMGVVGVFTADSNVGVFLGVLTTSIVRLNGLDGVSFSDGELSLSIFLLEKSWKNKNKK